MFGKCQIEVEIPGIFGLFFNELFNPFFLFQIYSVTLWFIQGYTNYAYCIAVTAVITLTATIYNAIAAAKKIKAMAEYSCNIRVIRSNQERVINSIELVPTDLVLLD